MFLNNAISYVNFYMKKKFRKFNANLYYESKHKTRT